MNVTNRRPAHHAVVGILLVLQILFLGAPSRLSAETLAWRLRAGETIPQGMALSAAKDSGSVYFLTFGLTQNTNRFGKVNSSGQVQWMKDTKRFYVDLKSAPGGFFYLLGNGLAKYNSRGVKVWSRPSSVAGAWKVAVSPSGKAIYTLWWPYGKGLRIRRFDSGGNVKWTKTVGPPTGSASTAIAVGRSGLIYVAGQFSDSECFVACLSPTGQVKWSRTVSPFGNPVMGLALAAGGDESLYLAGANEGGPRLLKLNAVTHDVEWGRSVPSNQDWGDYNGIAVSPVSGDVYVTGSTQDFLDPDPMMKAKYERYSPAGDSPWIDITASAPNDYYGWGTGVDVAPNGDIYFLSHYLGFQLDKYVP